MFVRGGYRPVYLYIFCRNKNPKEAYTIGGMEFYALNVGGIVLRVRKTERGWEPSVIGPATVLDAETAKSIAEDYARRITGREIIQPEWNEEHST